MSRKKKEELDEVAEVEGLEMADGTEALEDQELNKDIETLKVLHKRSAMHEVKQAVSLRTFCSVSKLKVDQLAGFIYAMQKDNYRSMSVNEWWEKYNEFMGRKV